MCPVLALPSSTCATGCMVWVIRYIYRGKELGHLQYVPAWPYWGMRPCLREEVDVCSSFVWFLVRQPKLLQSFFLFIADMKLFCTT